MEENYRNHLDKKMKMISDTCCMLRNQIIVQIADYQTILHSLLEGSEKLKSDSKEITNIRKYLNHPLSVELDFHKTITNIFEMTNACYTLSHEREVTPTNTKQIEESIDYYTRRIYKQFSSISDQIKYFPPLMEKYRSHVRTALDWATPSEANTLNRIKFQANHIVRSIIGNPCNWMNFSFSLSEEEIKETVNEVICYLLLSWLQKAANTRQTHSLFLKKRFTLKENQAPLRKHGSSSLVIPSDLSSLNYNQKFYESIKVVPQELQTNSADHNNNEESSEYDFIELCFLDHYQNDDILLLRYLLNYKYPLKVVSNTRTKHVVQEGYEKYFEYLEKLRNETDSKLFVIDSLFFYLFETSFRFLLAYQICQYRIKHGIEAKRKPPIGLVRYTNSFEVTGYMSKSVNYKSFLLRLPQNLIHDAHKYKTNEDDYTRVVYKRIIIDKAISIFNACSPFNMNSCWAEADFEDVAAFLRDDYKIGKVLEGIDQSLFRVDGKSVEDATENAEFIREFFMKSKFVDVEQLELWRKRVASSKKSKSKENIPK